MSLLTPLYVLGLLAISLPVVFHLIRRMPKGEFPFSSLMFLSPSPPRLTRPSRLEHWLLLLLRALAIGLLAFAFARPFWRQTTPADPADGDARRLAVLVDTSASMKIEHPRFEPADLARAAMGKGILDFRKGLQQSLPPTRAASPHPASFPTTAATTSAAQINHAVAP